jgi:Zn-finger nucleic acid-binding protein
MSLRCPACSRNFLTPLTDKEMNLEIDFCKQCKGLWFDDKEIREFIKSKKFNKIFLPEVLSSITSQVTVSISTSQRACPRCLVTMEQRIHCGVEFDFCMKCKGIWLDDGEINQIVTAYRRGKAGSDAVIRQELEAAFKGDSIAVGNIINIIANFFRDFFDTMKKK